MSAPTSSYPGFSEVARSFAPGWFSAVMGTGVLAITTHALAVRWSLLATMALALHYFNLIEHLPFQVHSGVFIVFGLLFWGFGVWWTVMASLLTLAARRRGMLPFALSWRGFIFPLGAFVVSSFRLSRRSGIESVGWVGTAAWGLLLAL